MFHAKSTKLLQNGDKKTVVVSWGGSGTQGPAVPGMPVIMKGSPTASPTRALRFDSPTPIRYDNHSYSDLLSSTEIANNLRTKMVFDPSRGGWVQPGVEIKDSLDGCRSFTASLRLVTPDGSVCMDGSSAGGWQYPNQHEGRSIDYFLDEFTSVGWITVDSSTDTDSTGKV